MTADTHESSRWPELQRVRRAIVVVDIVESVRLMQQHEDDVIDRWRRFVHEVRDELLPAFRGRMVKSLGDGMLLEFVEASDAAAATLALHRRIGSTHDSADPARALWLRAGVHVGDIVVDEVDVFGPSVNIAARLAGIAGRGETIVSADVRAQLHEGLDAECEDLGDCWLKHVDQPVRAARLHPVARPALAGLHADASAPARERIGVAVIPTLARDGAPEAGIGLGDLLADDIIAQLSRLPHLKVISRLSTQGFRQRDWPLQQVAHALDVDYVLHGSHAVRGGSTRIALQLVECGQGITVWADTVDAPTTELRDGFCDTVDAVVQQVGRALLGQEVRRACMLPLPTLPSYTILLGATALLHSLSRRDFERAREMLDYLAERHPRLAAPRAWLGLWHVMRVGQGWSHSAADDAGRAQQAVHTALSLDPSHALSLAIDGLIAAYIHKDMALAGERYEAALRANPNEGLAWLYRSAWHAYREEGDQAVDAALRAQALSPLDPQRYYYDNFTSTAMLAQGDLDGAIRYGSRSLRGNALHGPTVRILAIAHALSGDLDHARAMVDRMRRIEPDFSIERFRARYPGTRPAQVERYVQALREAGLPER